MRILLLGLDNAGKTTCVKKYCCQDTSTVSPTLGFQITPLQHRQYTLHIWDVGGQQSLRSYWRNYFESSDGLIWVVDSNDVARLQDCKRELHELLKEERLAGASLVLFLNKQDIPTALPPTEVAAVLEVDKLRDQRRHVHVVVCSAKTGEGLLEGVDWLVDDVAARAYIQ